MNAIEANRLVAARDSAIDCRNIQSYQQLIGVIDSRLESAAQNGLHVTTIAFAYMHPSEQSRVPDQYTRLGFHAVGSLWEGNYILILRW